MVRMADFLLLFSFCGAFPAFQRLLRCLSIWKGMLGLPNLHDALLLSIFPNSLVSKERCNQLTQRWSPPDVQEWKMQSSGDPKVTNPRSNWFTGLSDTGTLVIISRAPTSKKSGAECGFTQWHSYSVGENAKFFGGNAKFCRSWSSCNAACPTRLQSHSRAPQLALQAWNGSEGEGDWPHYPGAQAPAKLHDLPPPHGNTPGSTCSILRVI